MGKALSSLFNNVYSGKRVLLTGDTGFKGSWLAIWLNQLGAEVFGYALPYKNDYDNYSICNLNSKISHKNGDVRDKESLISYFNEIKPEIAFHLAAQPIVLEAYKNPHYTFETNVMGTVNFLEALKDTSSVKSAVLVTSDKVYKNLESDAGYTEDSRLGGSDPYSSSKACDEIIVNSYLQSFLKDSNCSVATARAGNVIGGGDWGEYRLIPDFFRAIIKNESILLRNPNFVRPWQFVLEPLGGYLLLAANLFLYGDKFSGAWNFGPSKQEIFTVQQVIEKIVQVVKKGKYEFSDIIQKEKETKLLTLNAAKSKELLGWQSLLNFDETIEFTAKGYDIENSIDDYFQFRVDQIKKYIDLGREKQIEWILNSESEK